MKFQKLLLSILAITAFALSTACSSSEATGREGHKRTTFLGIYTSEPASFGPAETCNFNIEGNSLINETLPEGNKVSWFWGLITYTD